MQPTTPTDAPVSRLATQPGGAPHFDVSHALDLLRRTWLFPLAGCLIGVAAAVLYIAVTPSLYKSSARILLDRSTNRYLQANKIIDEPVLEDADAASQVHILSSESIILPVVRSMRLTQDAEFVGSHAAGAAERMSGLDRVLDGLRGLFGSSPQAHSDHTLERIAVETFQKRLTVFREDVPSVISITFSSEDAQKAAAIANAIAEAYLKANFEAKASSTRMAGQMLQERMSDLKQQAAEAERILQEFKLSNSLGSGAKASESPEQVSNLGAQLAIARAQMAEAKARLQLVQQEPREAATLARVADNEVILKLRVEYLELSMRLKELEGRVGLGHAASLKLQRRIADVKSAMLEEQRRIANSYSRDYQLAKARNDEIEATLTSLTVGPGGPDGQARVIMRELESAAETLRRSYNAALQRFNEVSKTDDVVGPDARIITRAAPPLRKTSRKGMVALGGGITLGLLLGFGAAFGRELASGVIRTPGQVREITEAYCAVVPLVSLEPNPSTGSDSRRMPLDEHVLDAPFSRFAEAFRNAYAILTARQDRSRGDVVCVVAAVAKEGKTTITTNLGALIASARQRVLVIDGDLHRRSLTKALAPQATEGLIEAIQDPSRLTSLIVNRPRSGLDVLPCPLALRTPNAADLLGSPQMEEVLNSAREMYDFIIIESPPIMSVVDVKMTEHLVDHFVMVVEWGSTRKRLVREALIEAEGIRDRLACVMLNKVDPSALKIIESYKGPRFDDYYEA